MAVAIRLKRMGAKHDPKYRIVVVDSRKKRDGRVIEELGYYDPVPNPSIIKVDTDRAVYWLGVGAQPSKAVRRMLVLDGAIAKANGKEDVESWIKVAQSDKESEVKEAVAAAEDTAMKTKAKIAEEKAAEAAKKQEEAVEKADADIEAVEEAAAEAEA